MSWETIEYAMHAAVVMASGFPADRVIWSYQNKNAPPDDYIEISFGGLRQVGLDWMRADQDLTRPNGQEIRQVISGVRETSFDITVFTSRTTGSQAARHVAELVRTRFQRDDVRHIVRKASVSPYDSGPVNYAPDMPNVDFRGRATVSMFCYVPLIDCVQYVGYIARIRGVVYPQTAAGVPISFQGSSGIPFDTTGVTGHSGS